MDHQIFVIERDNRAEQINIEGGTTNQIGTPAQTLDGGIVKKIVSNFQSI